ncbi:MAG: DUF2207 domain-containing protein [Bacteroidota bacterium]
MRRFLFFFLFLPLSLISQQEVFKSWHTTGTLRSDGTLELEDNITAVVAGKKIKRGITRGLHRKPLGDDVKMGRFDYVFQEATRDGATSKYHTRDERGQTVVYFGDKDILLAPGTYRYGLRFTAPRQIYFTDQVEEIRWPVIGLDNELPVESASFSVEIPEGMVVQALSCYTGRKGAKEQACRMAKVGSRLDFTLQRPLAPGEGFTVAAGFPVGSFVRPATPLPPERSTLEEKGALYLGVFGLLAGLLFGYRSWQKYGIDPPTPEVGPQFYPPNDLSPASMGYINRTMMDQSQVTASLTALAVKGFVEIAEVKEKRLLGSHEMFVLRPLEKGGADDLPREQAVLYYGLLSTGEIALDGQYNEHLKEITDGHHDSVKDQHKAFVNQGANFKKIIPVGLIFLATVIGSGIFVADAPMAGKIAFGAALVALIIGTPIFAWLIRQPSEEKVELWAKIKAFKEYLQLSEKKRKAVYGAPEMTEAYFQQVLPYAIVMGIENNWAADLQSDLTGTATTPQHSNHHHYLHQPWMMQDFGSRMGSAYGAVSSPPSSSSGGGFSGGGGSVGGGGGGGGW